MIDARKGRKAEKGSVIIEPTQETRGWSGAIAAMRGYRCIIVMPEGLSQERQTLMKHGAEVILTPATKG